MDENTWRLAQVMMWLIGIQTTVILSAFGAMWIIFSKKFEDIDKSLNKLNETVISMDKRLVVVETMMHMKECCMLKDERNHRKVE